MAMNWDILKSRYLETSRSSQLDSLRLNLIRLQTLAASGTEESMARHLVRESQFFIEWTVPSLSLETELLLATELVSLQRQLSGWKLNWSALWHSERERQQISTVAQQWYEQLQGQSEAIPS